MLDLVRGYYTTSMALYPDEKDGPGKNYIMLCCCSRCLNTSSKDGPSSLYFTLTAKLPTRTQYGFFTLLQITEHSFTHRQGFINVNGAQVYKLRLVYCPNINRLHRFPTARV